MQPPWSRDRRTIRRSDYASKVIDVCVEAVLSRDFDESLGLTTCVRTRVRGLTRDIFATLRMVLWLKENSAVFV